MSTPVFIVCHNNGCMVRDTVEALIGRFTNARLVVVDEASTAPHTLEVLRELEESYGVSVNRHRKNAGPKRVRRYPRYWPMRRKPFVLTDPDLELRYLPEDTLDVLRTVAADQGVRCVGLALDISAQDDLLEGSYFKGKSIAEWESQFWKVPVDLSHLRPDLSAYRAPIDTTFAYYDFSRPKGNTIRVAGRYTVRHLPWHKSYIQSLGKGDFNDCFGETLKPTTTSALARQFFNNL